MADSPTGTPQAQLSRAILVSSSESVWLNSSSNLRHLGSSPGLKRARARHPWQRLRKTPGLPLGRARSGLVSGVGCTGGRRFRAVADECCGPAFQRPTVSRVGCSVGGCHGRTPPDPLLGPGRRRRRTRLPSPQRHRLRRRPVTVHAGVTPPAMAEARTARAGPAAQPGSAAIRSGDSDGWVTSRRGRGG